MINKKIFSFLGVCAISIAPNSVFAKTNALHYAVSVDDPAYINELISKHSLSLYEKNTEGNSPVHVSAINNKVLAYMAMSNFIDNVQEKNILGQTPIVLASKNNSLEVAYALMLSGADPYEKDKYNFNAFDYAKKLESPLMYEILSTFDFKKDINKLKTRIEFLTNKLNGKEENSSAASALKTEIDFFKKILEKKDIKINSLEVENKEKDQRIKEIMELYNTQKIELEKLKLEVGGYFGDNINKKEVPNPSDIKDQVILQNNNINKLKEDKMVGKNAGSMDDVVDNIQDIPIQSERYISYDRDPREVEILKSLGLEVRDASAYIPSISEKAFSDINKSFSPSDENNVKLFINKLIKFTSKPILIIKKK